VAARHKKRHPRPTPRKRSPVVFDRFSVSDIERWAAWGEAGRRFHWDWYSDLAYQRSLIAGKIRAVLLEAAEPSKFNGKANLAIYPKNFGGESFVELADAVPEEVKTRRLDATTSATL